LGIAGITVLRSFCSERMGFFAQSAAFEARRDRTTDHRVSCGEAVAGVVGDQNSPAVVEPAPGSRTAEFSRRAPLLDPPWKRERGASSFRVTIRGRLKPER
jgi:hypothetical protein